MTTKLFSRAVGHISAGAALALLIGLGAGTAAFADELKAPAGKSRLLRDNDVTVIIIDKHKKRSKHETTTPGKSKSPQLRQPSSRISRDDDELTIRFNRDRKTGSGSSSARSERSGPKIIIIDKNTNGCNGGGVCVIRP